MHINAINILYYNDNGKKEILKGINSNTHNMYFFAICILYYFNELTEY